jgi:hypothetical protein
MKQLYELTVSHARIRTRHQHCKLPLPASSSARIAMAECMTMLLAWRSGLGGTASDERDEVRMDDYWWMRSSNFKTRGNLW